jgi:hypothetical protein
MNPFTYLWGELRTQHGLPLEHDKIHELTIFDDVHGDFKLLTDAQEVKELEDMTSKAVDAIDPLFPISSDGVQDFISTMLMEKYKENLFIPRKKFLNLLNNITHNG